VKRRPIGVGIIGGGLMGREIASAFARWRALVDVTIEPKLVGVADLNPAALENVVIIPTLEGAVLETNRPRIYGAFKMITGGIFEVGFPDLIQQMWAAFLMERESALGERFGCATPVEAVWSQQLFAAALESQTTGETISVSWHKVNRST
jgi:hypothetical protein